MLWRKCYRRGVERGQMMNGIEMVSTYSLRRWHLNWGRINEEKWTEGRAIHSGRGGSSAGALKQLYAGPVWRTARRPVWPNIVSKELVVGEVANRGREGPPFTRPDRVCFRVWIFSTCNGRTLGSFGWRMTWYDLHFNEQFLHAVWRMGCWEVRVETDKRPLQ